MISHVDPVIPPNAVCNPPNKRHPPKKGKPADRVSPNAASGFFFSFSADHLIPSSSTSKMSVLFGGISGLGLFAP
jgi:hypothetical protein